jgi:hypothetical protein
VVVPVSLVDGDTPDVLPVLLEPVLPAVPPEFVSEPVVLPLPEAPMELVPGPPVVPVVLLPLAVWSVVELPLVEPVLPVAPAVVDGLVVVELLDVAPVLAAPLSAALCLEQAPSDRAAATANTAAAVLVRDVFMVGKTPSRWTSAVAPCLSRTLWFPPEGAVGS